MQLWIPAVIGLWHFKTILKMILKLETNCGISDFIIWFNNQNIYSQNINRNSNLFEHTEIMVSSGAMVNLLGNSLSWLLSTYSSRSLGREPIHSGSATIWLPETDSISRLFSWLNSVVVSFMWVNKSFSPLCTTI